MIFLWFAYLFGKRRIGYVSCLVGGVGCYVVTGIVLLSGNTMLIGLAETIGFVFWGTVLLVGQQIHKRKLSNL